MTTTTFATTARTGLSRHAMGPFGLLLFCVSASAPMTVFAGGVPATYAATGVVGVPLSFVALGLALWLCSVGYGQIGRFVVHAGPFYAYLAQGWGRAAGIAGGAVALTAYNAIQTSLYGLTGATIAGLTGIPWWLGALGAWALVAVLGVLRVHVNARLLAVLLGAEVLLIAAFDVAAFTHPAGGHISATPLHPTSLAVPGVGGVFALGVAAFVGFESAAAFTEETRTRTAARRAIVTSVVSIAALYAVSSWAVAVAVGADRVVDLARDPAAGLPMSTVTDLLGPYAGQLAVVLLVTSMLAAMLSFHSTVARYVYALARDGVLPSRWARIGSGGTGGAPVAGSLLQTTVGGAAIAVFAVAGLDPVGAMFTWLSAVAAIGIMALLAATALAVARYFRGFNPTPGDRDAVTRWSGRIAPTLGAVLLTAVLVTTLANVSSVLGGVRVPVWLMPAVVAVPVAAGLLWAWRLSAIRPDVYARAGRSVGNQLATLDHSLDRYDV